MGMIPERTADTMSIAIAMSSPSGRMSKRARKAAEARLHDALFGPNYKPEPPKQTQESKNRHRLQCAAELRRLAGLGMRPRVHLREALRIEAEVAGSLAEK